MALSGEDEKSCVGGDVSCSMLVSPTCSSAAFVNAARSECLDDFTLLVGELDGLLYALE